MVFMMRLGEKKTLRRNSLGKLGRGEISHETTEQPDEARVEAEEDGRRMRGTSWKYKRHSGEIHAANKGSRQKKTRIFYGQADRKG